MNKMDFQRVEIPKSELARHDWISRRLGQLGIDARQSKHHAQMRFYLTQLRDEIKMTEEFLAGDQ